MVRQAQARANLDGCVHFLGVKVELSPSELRNIRSLRAKTCKLRSDGINRCWGARSSEEPRLAIVDGAMVDALGLLRRKNES